MKNVSDNNMATLIPAGRKPRRPMTGDALPTRCILCSFDAIYDYDAPRCVNSRTSSTSVTTTYDEEAGLTDNCELFKDAVDGYEQDTAGIGMSLYGYRFYKPELGRWVNQDPLLNVPNMQRYITQVLGEGYNIYMFVKNAPIHSVDPFGLAGCSASSCCICDSIDVTFAPGGASFGGVVLNTAYGRFGNTIHVVHNVTGDPTKCSYEHNESGSYWWDTPYGSGTGTGTSNDATTAADINWGCDYFEYWDRLGLTKPTPLLSGDYFMGFSDDFTMQMKCTGTDGVTISSPVYSITGNYLDTVP